MKVGWYKDDLEEFTGFFDVDCEDCIKDVAQSFADDNHEIDEPSDMDFEVYVQDEEGVIHKVKFYTEYDPRYEVKSVELANKEE